MDNGQQRQDDEKPAIGGIAMQYESNRGPTTSPSKAQYKPVTPVTEEDKKDHEGSYHQSMEKIKQRRKGSEYLSRLQYYRNI